MMGRDAPPARVLPKSDLNLNSACPPSVAALMLNAPPVPRRVVPVANRGMSVPAEFSSSVPPLMVVPPVHELAALVMLQVPEATLRRPLPLRIQFKLVTPVPVPPKVTVELR